MKSRSRAIAVTASLLVLASLAACGNDSPAAAGDEDALTVGLMQQARGSDEPWSGAWSDSADALSEADADVEVSQTYDAADPTKAEPVARQLLDQGADVLLMSSFQMADIAATLSQEYADVPMLVTSFGEPQQPNMWLGTASYLEIGYATCWYLATASDDARIGVVAALDDPAQKEVQQGCGIGAEAADPATEITTVNTNSYTDQQASREQTTKLLDDGVEDIFFVSASAESLGGLALCEEQDATCATWGAPATNYAPDVAGVSVEIDWSVAMEEMVAQARSGELEAQVFDATFGNAGLKVDTSAVPADIQADFDAVLAGLADESIELPDSEAHPGYR